MRTAPYEASARPQQFSTRTSAYTEYLELSDVDCHRPQEVRIRVVVRPSALHRLYRLVPEALRMRLGRIRRRFARGDAVFVVSWFPARLILGVRGRFRSDGRSYGIDRLSAMMLINLSSRPDRLEAFTRETHKLGLERFDRFEAIADPVGILGCSQSHVECLRRMIEHRWECVMICEDDAHFTLTRRELDVLVEAFLNDPRAEVACLAFKHHRVVRHSALFLRALDTQTMACYLVKSTIAHDLHDVLSEGVERLRSGADRMVYSCDMVWKRLQRQRVFVVPIIRAARQSAGYSDVETTMVDYGI